MSNLYETSTLVSEYLLFHFGASDEILPPSVAWPRGMADALDFAVRTPSHFSNQSAQRGLDLGCAVGRSTFEMSKNCAEVIGIDFSHAFIAAADQLRARQSVAYSRRDEAHLQTPLTAKIPDGFFPENVSFHQGDAMDLSADLGTFDRIHAANLLCRLTDPIKLLDRLPSLMNAGGQLILATPCTWLEQFTPPQNWPDADTLSWLKNHLGKNFRLLLERDEPFLIRETARKFQWTRSQLTLWERVS